MLLQKLALVVELQVLYAGISLMVLLVVAVVVVLVAYYDDLYPNNLEEMSEADCFKADATDNFDKHY